MKIYSIVMLGRWVNGSVRVWNLENDCKTQVLVEYLTRCRRKGRQGRNMRKVLS